MRTVHPGPRWFFVLVVTLLPASAHPSGFSVFTQNAKALAQANAVIAHADGPSTLFYNPALAGELPGTQVEIGTTMVYDDRRFKSDQTGATTGNESDAKFPSSFYLTHALDDRLTLGVAGFSPFGLGTQWADTWEGRYIATRSELTTYVVNPTVTWRALPWFSVAVGVDYMMLDSSLEKKLNFGPLGLGDGSQKFTADGDAWGYNLAVAVKPTESLQVGLAYRSGFDARLNGHIRNSPPPGTPGALAAQFPDTKAGTVLHLPDQVQAGVAYRLTERLLIEGAFRWENWSTYSQLTVDLKEPIRGQTSQTMVKDWHDSHAFLFGAQYRLDENWTLMAGYLYETSPVPDRTFEPASPDSDSHVFSAGVSFRWLDLETALGYGFQWKVDRDKHNSVGAAAGGTANGRYESYIHLLGVSLTYRF
jgi:long-chain fatty acid transport protein